MKPTLEELIKLENETEAEKTRVAKAIKFGICPECGEKLIREDYEKYDVPKRLFFGLFKSEGTSWDYRVVCPNNKKHYEEKYDYIMMNIIKSQ